VKFGKYAKIIWNDYSKILSVFEESYFWLLYKRQQ